MKITYTQNPLDTIIELDEHEQKEFWYKLKIENLIERLFSVHYEFTYKKEAPNIEQVLREVNPDHYMADEGQDPVDRRADEMLVYYLDALKGKHVGDCTCVPCSCDKCHAESMLGIDTIKGLGKHQAYKVDSASKDRTINEAIDYLKNYEQHIQFNDALLTRGWKTRENYEQYIPGWVQEAHAAAAWLEQYRNEHFPKE